VYVEWAFFFKNLPFLSKNLSKRAKSRATFAPINQVARRGVWLSFLKKK
jgi:hypothetical protein